MSILFLLFTLIGYQPVSAIGAESDAKVLWDAWYTVTLGGQVKYAYYNDLVEIKKNRVHFQNRMWKKEEGYLNEEQIGAFAENNPALTPLFFNFHSVYRSTETSIDGTIQDGKVLTVRVRKGKDESPLIKKYISKKVILSVFFPVWLKNRLTELKKGHPVSFETILEDNLEADFSPVHGQLRLEEPDSYASKNKAKKLTIDYRGLRSTWWVNESGIPLRIEIPQQKIISEKVSKETAQKFLDD